MTDISIKDYIARAKELEVALYKQQQLMHQHEQLLLSKRPMLPTKEVIDLPPVPNMTEPAKEGLGCNWWFMFLGAIACSWMAIEKDLPIFLLFGIVCAYICFSTYCARNNRYNTALDKYKVQQFNYNSQLQIAKTKNTKSEELYKQRLSNYNLRIAECKQCEEAALANHTECVQEIEKALLAHYSVNCLFPKYRNLVAVTTIDEYLQSGRCTTLEGSDGAYNLYEMELRQNIVIGQLSSILSNMEQIKNNQYTLYQELATANASIEDIMTEIKSLHTTEKLNAYFASVAVKIAASPTYIHGHIY